MMQAPFCISHSVRDHPARLLLLSEVSMLPPHDGIRRIGRSHLSRAVESAPHEFPRSHPIPSSSRDASARVEEVEQIDWLPSCLCCSRGPTEVSLIAPHPVEYDGELTRNRDHGFLHAAPTCDGDAPGFERVPTAWPGQNDKGRFIKA